MAFRGVDRGQLLSTRRMKAQPTRSGGLEGAANMDQSRSGLDGVHITRSGNTHRHALVLEHVKMLAHTYSYIRGV